MASDWTMQFLADILGAAVERPVVLETTAWVRPISRACRRACCLGPEVFAKTGKRQKRFMPKMDEKSRALKLAGWVEALRKLLA